MRTSWEPSATGTSPPLNFHFRMLKQYKNYHETAKQQPFFSLLDSLQVLSRFCYRDEWLNKMLNEEITLLREHGVLNPYHQSAMRPTVINP